MSGYVEGYNSACAKYQEKAELWDTLEKASQSENPVAKILKEFIAALKAGKEKG